MHSASSNHPKSVIFDEKFIPQHRGRSKSKGVSQKWHGRNFLNDGDGFPMVKLPQISSLFDKSLSPQQRWRSQLEAVSQKPHGRNYFYGGDVYPWVKLAKISHLFDNKVFPGVGGAPSQKPISKKLCGRNFLNGAVAFSTFKCPKINHLFDKSLSPGGSRGIILSPSCFPNLTLHTAWLVARTTKFQHEIHGRFIHGLRGYLSLEDGIYTKEFKECA